MAETSDHKVPCKRTSIEDSKNNISKRKYEDEKDVSSFSQSSHHSDNESSNEPNEDEVEKPFNLVEYLKCDEDDEEEPLESESEDDNSEDEDDSESDDNENM